MNLLPEILVKVTLFTIMLSLGVSVDNKNLLGWIKRPGFLLRILVASCVVVPLLALMLLQSPLTAGLSPASKYAIALMALCPSAPLTLRKAAKAGGDRQLAAVLQVCSALTAVISVPLLAGLFRSLFAIEGWQIDPADVAIQVLTAQVLPLLIGIAIRVYKPIFASRIEKNLERLANFLLALLLVVLLVKIGPDLPAFIATNLTSLVLMVVLVALSLAIGYGLATGAGCNRRTAALLVTMRNPGLALLFASTHGGHLIGIKLAIITYVILTIALTTVCFKVADLIKPA